MGLKVIGHKSYFSRHRQGSKLQEINFSFDDIHVSRRRGQEDKGLWVLISTDYSEDWRQFLALGSIKKGEFPKAVVLNGSCDFFKVSTAWVRWRCMVFRRKLSLTKGLSLGGWLTAWGRALWKHITTVGMLSLLMCLPYSHAALVPVQWAFGRRVALGWWALCSLFPSCPSPPAEPGWLQLKTVGILPTIFFFLLQLTTFSYYKNNMYFLNKI